MSLSPPPSRRDRLRAAGLFLLAVAPTPLVFDDSRFLPGGEWMASALFWLCTAPWIAAVMVWLLCRDAPPGLRLPLLGSWAGTVLAVQLLRDSLIDDFAHGNGRFWPAQLLLFSSSLALAALGRLALQRHRRRAPGLVHPRRERQITLAVQLCALPWLLFTGVSWVIPFIIFPFTQLVVLSQQVLLIAALSERPSRLPGLLATASGLAVAVLWGRELPGQFGGTLQLGFLAPPLTTLGCSAEGLALLAVGVISLRWRPAAAPGVTQP